jgi:hypothetical protein
MDMVWSLPSAPGTVTVCAGQGDTRATGGGAGSAELTKGGHRCTQSQGISYVHVKFVMPDIGPIGCATSKLGWPFDGPQKKPPAPGKNVPTLRRFW